MSISVPPRLPGPRSVLASASVAGVLGLAAVLTAEPVVAVAAGTASAVTAVLVLFATRATTKPDPEPEPEPVPDADRRGGVADRRVEQPHPPSTPPAGGAGDDPLRALFESGPPPGDTGLLAEQFLVTTLRGRVAVARRALRPLSVVCFEVLELHDGAVVAPIPTVDVAMILRHTLRESDVAGRFEGDAYVCILEDTGEDGAVWTAERLRRNLAEAGAERRFRAGVASYPTHGLEAEELEAKARAALAAARDWTQDRIEVAGAP